MMFLLRMTFWLMLICLLLPSSREESGRLMSSASKAVDDMRGFCGRNPEVCQDAKGAATAMLAKMKNGMELAQSWLTASDSSPAANRTEDPPAAARLDPTAKEPPPQIMAVPRWDSSLKAQDRLSPWRGPASKL